MATLGDIASVLESRLSPHLRSLVIDLRGKSSDGPRRQALPGDPFNKLYERLGVMKPPYPPDWLALIPEYSDTLVGLLDAYCTLVEGTPTTLDRAIPPGKTEPPEVSERELEDQRATAEELVSGLSVDGLSAMRRKTRLDKLLIGGRFMEVVRDPNDANFETLPRAQPLSDEGLPVIMEHLPAVEMRLARLDDEQVARTIWRHTRQGTWRQQVRWDYFRRFCQIKGRKVVWFKEFGDPRVLHKDTGEFLRTDAEIAGARSRRQIATEVIYDPYYLSSRTPYGLSPFLGTLLNITGNRKAAECNWNLFENGLHIPLLLMIAGGALTTESMKRLDERIEQAAGVENWHKIMTLEAAPMDAAARDVLNPAATNPVKMEVHPLKQFMESDALFQNYTMNNDDKIRRVLRMPPILTGETKDQYTYATAIASLRMFEETVAEPARDETDAIINNKLFPEHGIEHFTFRTTGVNIDDIDQIGSLLSVGTQAGALDANEVRRFIGRALNADLQPRDDEWASIPAKVMEIAKNGNREEQEAARAAIDILIRAVRGRQK